MSLPSRVVRWTAAVAASLAVTQTGGAVGGPGTPGPRASPPPPPPPAAPPPPPPPPGRAP
ncbi:hypothetical protein [Nocardia brasiliensis]|uniref:hypothetical protein n=1 Tax=Nocardia brasiliensis TaxID=37326 RepID=UPI00245845E2|nr:hypothetical protein [Nocardia brasiliensis]